MDGTVLLFEEQREKGVVEVNPGGPVLLLGLQKKPFHPHGFRPNSFFTDFPQEANS
jgi:hypothetical protein